MVSLLICGDFVPSHRVSPQIELGQYDCLEAVKPFLKQVDYSIVNFESPVVTRAAKPIDKTGPNLCCTEKAMDCVAKIGFSCVTLANNHFRDYGQVGVEDTLSICKKKGIDYVGGGANLDEARHILYKDINGKRLAIINVCEKEWSIAGDDYGGSAPLNPIADYSSIQDARHNADYVIIIVHGGIEGYQFPTPRMVDTYRFFVDVGADAVINHHQHCFSGYEVYNRKPIFYGTGNFCFDINQPSNTLWSQGYMVQLLFEGDAIDFNIIPYSQCAKSPRIDVLNGRERDSVYDRIKHINSLIACKEELIKQFENHVNSIRQGRLLEFEPFDNRIIRGLQIKKILPSFVSKKTRKDVFDVINCESHREVILNIFNNLLLN